MDKSIAHHKNHGVGMMILVIMFTVSASLSAGGGGGGALENNKCLGRVREGRLKIFVFGAYYVSFQKRLCKNVWLSSLNFK